MLWCLQSHHFSTRVLLGCYILTVKIKLAGHRQYIKLSLNLNESLTRARPSIYITLNNEMCKYIGLLK